MLYSCNSNVDIYYTCCLPVLREMESCGAVCVSSRHAHTYTHTSLQAHVPCPQSLHLFYFLQFRAISAVIEGSVKQYLFGPSSPRQQLPAETDSTKSSSNKVCSLSIFHYIIMTSFYGVLRLTCMVYCCLTLLLPRKGNHIHLSHVTVTRPLMTSPQ